MLIRATFVVVLGVLGASACRAQADDSCTLADTGSYPGLVVDHFVNGPDNINTNPKTPEGAPDCDVADTPDLSLGSGYVVFDIGCQYQPHSDGPEFRVWEADNSYCVGFAAPEGYRVSVSSDGENYQQVGAAEGVGHFNTDEAFRFVRIQSTQAADSVAGPTPGPDIDALEML